MVREKNERVPRSRHKESRDTFIVMSLHGRATILAEVKDRLHVYIPTNRYRGWRVSCTFTREH